MKRLALICLAALCLGATAPPLPTNRVIRVLLPKPPVVPDTYGKSYTNVISSLPEWWRKFNGEIARTNGLVPHTVRHDAATGRITLDWPSAPGQQFVIWWTNTNGVLYPVFYAHTNVMVGTNMVKLPVYPRTEAWVGTNRSMVEFDWPTNRTGFVPGHWIVERKAI